MTPRPSTKRILSLLATSAASLALSLSFTACGGSDGDDDDEDGGSGGYTLPENCVQADQLCIPNATYGFRCKNGTWSTWTCDEGTTCHRADDGYLSCIPIGSSTETDAGTPTETDAGTPSGGNAGITYVSIPSGTYTIPVNYNSYHYVAGTPIPVAAFKIGKTPVTVAQFEKCVSAGRCQGVYGIYRAGNEDFDDCNYGRGSNWANHPMNCVNWFGAMEFCEWAGGRLPTEEEWSFAASHNGTRFLDTKYPWGNSAPTHCRHANYKDSGSEDRAYCNGTREVAYSESHGTSAVGTYSPAGDSPLGLVDMIGNVWEWTAFEFMGMDNMTYYAKSTPYYRELTTNNGGYSLGANVHVSGVGFRCAKDD